MSGPLVVSLYLATGMGTSQAMKAPKRMAPTSRQKTASGGIRIELATIPTMCAGPRDVSRKR